MKKKAQYLTLFLGGLICIGLAAIGPSLTGAGGPQSVAPAKSLSSYSHTDQMIIQYRDPSFVRNASAGISGAGESVHDRVGRLNARAGISLKHYRFMSGNAHVLKLPQKMTLAQARTIAAELKKDPDVLYAEPDTRMHKLLEPNDTRYSEQWHYKSSSSEAGGINLPSAWDKTTGSSSIVVAVIDTGYVPHADIDPSRIVQGYDFIDDVWTANDGDGRDSDPSDPGDWVAANACGDGEPADTSSWHGTHVSGTIGAKTNNSKGVAGVNWTSKILHARVLGRCGGYTSDIADAIRWSAGLSVLGVPANANPAKVLNISLGGDGSCSYTLQSAITAAYNAGASVVVAAGNESDDVANYHPGNCDNVIAVAAVNRLGGLASYSNYGTKITIAAPGGDGVTANKILSTLNTGTTSPVDSPAGDTYAFYRGTSMATPHVAGVISLMLSANPSLTPAQVLSRIQSSARTFPTGTGSDCTTSTCGAGIVNAAAAITDNPVPSISSLSPSSKSVSNSDFTLTVNGSDFVGNSVVRWNGSDRVTTYVSDSQLTAVILAADIASVTDVSVTVFNPAPGGGASAAVTFSVTKASATAAGGGGGGGGGGCFIATAAFGTPFEKHVSILREFRDRCLLTTSPGKAFVKFYYEVSPPIAAKIAESEGLRLITRCALMPLVGVAYLALTFGSAMVVGIAMSLIVMTGFLIRIIRRKITVAGA